MSEEKLSAVELKEKLKRTNEYVRDCCIRVSNGEIMDLTGLDRSVSQMCSGIEDLSSEEADILKEDMAKLVAGLDDLAKNIEKQKEG